jgi:hypothetical protein
VPTESGAKIMAESDLAEFRDRFRFWVVERLALKFALGGPVFFAGLSIEESSDSLKGWLDLNSSQADHAYGSHFRDPALTALYADEVKEVIEDLKKGVDEITKEMIATRDKP